MPAFEIFAPRPRNRVRDSPLDGMGGAGRDLRGRAADKMAARIFERALVVPLVFKVDASREKSTVPNGPPNVSTGFHFYRALIKTRSRVIDVGRRGPDSGHLSRRVA